jgi:glycerophosphoryl diester phosphodiesterase
MLKSGFPAAAGRVFQHPANPQSWHAVMEVQALIQRIKERRSRTVGPLVWPPLNIGHRGASGEAPENTLAGFELALRQGADGVELDVHLSADGIPVVIHDARLERTTSGRGWVREHRASTLRHLDAGSWFNRRFPSRARQRYAAARIPLLSEVLAWTRARQCLAFLEIKDATAGMEAEILEEIEEAGVQSLVTVVSFDLPTLRRIRQLDSRVALGLDTSRPATGRLAIRRAKSLGAVALLPYWAIASRRFIRRAHRNSLPVFAWTVDQPRWMQRRILDGVDGLLTNYPARLEEIRARLSCAGL